METSETTGAIAAALAKAHLEIDNPELDGVNPHFKSRFATLAAVLNAVRKPMAKQGIALMQSVAIAEGRVAVTTSLIHASGEWMRETMAFPIAGNSNVQQAGSVVTYLRRYSLISLCAIVGDPHEDDDGDEDRQEHNEQRKAQQRTTRDTFRPENARGAAPVPEPAREATEKPEPAKATPSASVGVMDKYPDEYEGDFEILRVTTRPGKPHAIHAAGEHGRVWISTKVDGYAEVAKEATGKTLRLDVARVGPTLEVMRVLTPSAPAAQKEESDALPF